MKIFLDIIKYFNQRVKLDFSAIGKLNQSTKEQAIVNGNAASELLRNANFGLQYNLYRFALLDELEASRDDAERIAIGLKVQGLREFIDHLEKQEYFGNSVKSKE